MITEAEGAEPVTDVIPTEEDIEREERRLQDDIDLARMIAEEEADEKEEELRTKSGSRLQPGEKMREVTQEEHQRNIDIVDNIMKANPGISQHKALTMSGMSQGKFYNSKRALGLTNPKIGKGGRPKGSTNSPKHITHQKVEIAPRDTPPVRSFQATAMWQEDDEQPTEKDQEILRRFSSLSEGKMIMLLGTVEQLREVLQ